MSIVLLTENAKKKIDHLCKENGRDAVFLNIKGGGCAGFEYDWGFIDLHEVRTGPDDFDEIIDSNEYKLVIGAESVMYLFGSQIDYIEKMFGSMFDIKNPSAQSSCGCGTSVSFDAEMMMRDDF